MKLSRRQPLVLTLWQRHRSIRLVPALSTATAASATTAASPAIFLLIVPAPASA